MEEADGAHGLISGPALPIYPLVDNQTAVWTCWGVRLPSSEVALGSLESWEEAKRCSQIEIQIRAAGGICIVSPRAQAGDGRAGAQAGFGGVGSASQDWGVLPYRGGSAGGDLLTGQGLQVLS